MQNKNNPENCQLEINYYKSPNHLFDDYQVKEMGPYRYTILCFIFRKTIGFHKKKDKISLSQIEDFTGIGRKKIISSIKYLIDGDYITKENIGINEYVLSKKHQKLVDSTSIPQPLDLYPSDTSASVPRTHTKETNTKETNTKEKKRPRKVPDTNHHKIIDAFDKGYKEINPKGKMDWSDDKETTAVKRMVYRCSKSLGLDRESVQVFEMLREKMAVYFRLAKGNDNFYGQSNFLPSFLNQFWNKITHQTIQALETPQQKHDREWKDYLKESAFSKTKVIPLKKTIAANNGHRPNPHGAYAK